MCCFVLRSDSQHLCKFPIPCTERVSTAPPAAAPARQIAGTKTVLEDYFPGVCQSAGNTLPCGKTVTVLLYDFRLNSHDLTPLLRWGKAQPRS